MKNGETKRKMHNNDNKVRLYEISELGDVDVLLVGFIPYPGFWQFSILSNEYGEIGWEDRLKELLEKAEEQTDWEIRGGSTTCELNSLLKEIEKVYFLNVSNLDNENAKF